MVYSKLLNKELNIKGLPEDLLYYVVNLPQDAVLKNQKSKKQMDIELNRLGTTKTRWLKANHPEISKKYLQKSKQKTYTYHELKDIYTHMSTFTNLQLVDESQLQTFNNKQKLAFKCKNCHRQFNKTFTMFMAGTGCINCKNKYKMIPTKKKKDDFLSKLLDYQHKILELYDYTYTGASIITTFTCKKCGYQINKSPYLFCHKFSGYCPGCSKKSMSHGEYYIYKTLLTYGIKFIKEYRVKISNSYRKYDFYLPEYNIFIEYDGVQHFSGKIFDRKKAEILKSDIIKTQYAEAHQIPLYRLNSPDPQEITQTLCNILGLEHNKEIDYLDIKEDEIVEYYYSHTMQETIEKYKEYKIKSQTVASRFKDKYGKTKTRVINDYLKTLNTDIANAQYLAYKEFGEFVGESNCELKLKTTHDRTRNYMIDWTLSKRNKKYGDVVIEWFKAFDRPYLSYNKFDYIKRKGIPLYRLRQTKEKAFLTLLEKNIEIYQNLSDIQKHKYNALRKKLKGQTLYDYYKS